MCVGYSSLSLSFIYSLSLSLTHVKATIGAGNRTCSVRRHAPPHHYNHTHTHKLVRGCVDPWAPDPVVRVGMDAKYLLGGVVAFFPEWLELWLTGTWAFWSYKGPRGAVPGAVAKG